MFDIAIIGLGPAGSTLARLLDPSLSVCVIDKKNLSGGPGFRKPCGGLLAPDAQKNIAKFGLRFPSEILADPQLFSVRTLDLKAKKVRYYQRFYLNFHRHQFDLWLASLIPSTVRIEDQARCTQIIKTKTGFQITYRRHGEEKEIFSRYVIGADGAHSLVRTSFCSTPIRQYLCIQQSFPTEEKLPPYYTCFFHPELTDCYGWINMKDGVVQLGAALPKQGARKKFEVLRRYFQAKGYPFATEVPIEACLVNRPASIKELELGKEGVFLIGEAAGFISPSSLEGISYSMESAKVLAQVFHEKTHHLHDAYEKASRPLRRRIFLKLMKSPFMYQPVLRRFVMESGITAMKVDHPKREEPYK